jgi:hypothetical protein
MYATLTSKLELAKYHSKGIECIERFQGWHPASRGARRPTGGGPRHVEVDGTQLSCRVGVRVFNQKGAGT